MSKKRNSRKKSIQNIQSIGCPHLHTHTLPQLGISTCFNCLMIYHNDCEYRKIEDSKDAAQSIKILQKYLEDIRVTADVNRLHIKFKNFFDDLSVFSSELDSLSKRLEVAIQQNNCQDFVIVKEDALKLMQKLENSQMMTTYAKHKVHSLLDIKVNGFNDAEHTSSSNELESIEKNNNSESEAWGNLIEETKDISKDDFIILTEANENRDLELKVKVHDDTIKDLESKVIFFEDNKNEVEGKCLRFETEIDNYKKLNEENIKKIDELEEGMSIFKIFTLIIRIFCYFYLLLFRFIFNLKGSLMC